MDLIIFLAFYLLLQGVLGENIICEQLPTHLCSFSVSYSGKRCVLENFATNNNDDNIDGKSGLITDQQCKTSEIFVDILHDWIESDECIDACGVDRKSVGISSDSLLQTHFISTICSPSCFQSCPNIVDLYFNLALAEGVYLPAVCEERKSDPRRSMFEFKSSGATSGSSHGPAAAPFSSFHAFTPALAPAPCP